VHLHLLCINYVKHEERKLERNVPTDWLSPSDNQSPFVYNRKEFRPSKATQVKITVNL